MPKQKNKPVDDKVVVEIMTPPPPPPPMPKPVPVQKTAQLVQQDEKKLSDPVTDAKKFISAVNQQVKKQTVSKNRGAFKNSDKSLTKKAESKKMNIQTHKDSDTAVKTEASKAKTASQTNDMIKDVDEGLETLLNAKEFKLYSYYNRIRVQLSEHWELRVKDKVHGMMVNGRSIASVDRVTKLMVILDRNGNLLKVQILEESGVSDLDDAVTEAFQSASPFPTPPPNIVEPDGTVKIRWDFFLDG